jgi:hypothetical protein
VTGTSLSGGGTSPYAAPVMNFCPRCGAQYMEEPMGEWVRANIRCPDCRLAITDIPAMLAPSDDEVAYVLDDWPVSDRGAASAALDEADIPFRWEEGLALVVPAAVEEQVDGILDQVQAEFSGAAPEDELEAAPDDGEDGGEEAQAAMADVFVAADRLQHEPFDKGAAEDLAAAAALVESSPPPFGIERALWTRIAQMASDLRVQLDGADVDGEALALSARELRDVLREYV